ncbi:MAG: hypothetical protein JNL39_15065 [Opitutaceae bacterium]|nr:hypothetical protein [Opitutaceae bacterium]
MKALLIFFGSFAAGLIMKSETPGVVRAALAEAAPAKKGDAAKKGEGKAPEPAKIEGMEVARRGGGYLGVAMVGGTFKISFYDAKKKPVTADVARAVLRWDPKYKVGSERVVLNRTEDGKALASPRNIRPPYLFKLYITLLKDAAEGEVAEGAGETHVIDFRA